MKFIYELHQHVEAALDHSTKTAFPPLHYRWPQLGQKLFAREQALTEGEAGHTEGVVGHAVTEQEKEIKREKIRNAVIAPLYRDEDGYSRDIRYLAFLLVKEGRAGELVGNPSAIEQDGSQQELPYTGLEGYYAGSERTSQRHGMTREEIIQEEANMGAELLKSLKKRAIEDYSWADFARLMHVLEGQRPAIEELRALQLLWTGVVRRLHVRVYHNPEFEPTLTEKIEHLERLLFCSSFKTKNQMKKLLEGEYHRLRDGHDQLSTSEQEQEGQEKQRRMRVRANRLEEFYQFRKATYEMLTTSVQGRYVLRVQDTSLEEATITEAITLPDLPDRSTYLPTLVHLTAEQHASSRMRQPNTASADRCVYHSACEEGITSKQRETGPMAVQAAEHWLGESIPEAGRAILKNLCMSALLFSKALGR